MAMTVSTSAPDSIKQRDGRVVPFDVERIRRAVRLCFGSLDRADDPVVDTITDRVVSIVTGKYQDGWEPTVEGVQDIVEMMMQASGEYEAAKHYILYRAEHKRQRAERPIPHEVIAAFEADKPYFPEPIQYFQWLDKYARFSEEYGRRETYHEGVDRVVRQYHELASPYADLGAQTYEDIRRSMLTMGAMPSMRMLSMAGPAFRRDNAVQYNCLKSSTQFVTDMGIRSFEDFQDGDEVKVMTHRGRWKKARVRSYGEQMFHDVTVVRQTSRHTVQATGDHRWLLKGGGETTKLSTGDALALPPLPIQTWDYYEQEPDARLMWAYGFVYGDGTLVKNQRGEYTRSLVRLCGEKTKYADRFLELGFSVSESASLEGDMIAYTRKYLKTLPDLETYGPDLVRAFVVGYLDADGHKPSGANQNRYTGIQASKPDAVDFIRSVFPVVGAYVTSEQEINRETNYGEHRGAIRFGLLTGSGTGANSYHYVREIEPSGRDEAWCLEVEDDHSFVMPTGVVTGNCTYLPIDGIDAWCEAMWLSMAGCGVGFSVEDRYVDQFRRVRRQKGGQPELWVIEDSSEGWVDALRRGCEAWFDGEDVVFNYTLIRPRGSILRTKGGRASGPEPLKRLLDFIRTRILARQGTTIRTIDAHDITCAVGLAAVSGGVRRSAMISIFDRDDQAMLTCKSGDFERENSQRWNANNSTVWESVDDISQVEFIGQFMEMVRSGRGEPGIFSRDAARLLMPSRRDHGHEFGSNPCGEIILRPWGMCNLTTVRAERHDTVATLTAKVEQAAIMGTIQSLGTYFPGLRPQWKMNCDDERLLGVDISGQMDCPLTYGESAPMVMEHLRDVAVRANRVTAERLGINPSAAVTCVKPSGNSSQLLNMGSGLHARWAPYYIRNVRVSSSSALARVLSDAGAPMEPENGDDPVNPRTWVVSFPIAAPEGAITRKDRTAIQQCEHWLMNKMHWTEHNPSVTITYQPHEILDLMNWVWDHRRFVGGMAFLPADDAKYDKLPYIEIDRAEYERRKAEFPEIDFWKVYRYESEDWTTSASTPACDGPSCDLEA